MRRKRGKRILWKTLAAWIAVTVLCAGAAAGPKKKTLPSHRIDLNRATLSQLEELPDIGPATARSILRFRRLSGPFQHVDDLLAIRGISRGRFDKIRPYVFVGKRESHTRHARPHNKQPSRH